MSRFPVFSRLTVTGYGLYPGRSATRGLEVDFQPGLTLILGANGLGKTTLVMMLFRLCTGPTDISILASGGSVGGANIEATPLRPGPRRMFAERVSDGAEHAEATLEVLLGEARVRITRSLKTLALTAFSVDGEELDLTESRYQHRMCELAQVSAFGDWILLLRHLTFYFEDRRRLVWDSYAQSEILRILFSAPEAAATWRKRRRSILELDSQVRNTQAIVTSEQRTLAGRTMLSEGAQEVRDELEVLSGLQSDAEPRLSELRETVALAEQARAHAHLTMLEAEQHQESAYRDMERRELLALATAFPSGDETATYLLSKLFSDGQCLACGAENLAARAELQARISHHACVVCGSAIPPTESTASFTPRSIARAKNALQRAGVEFDSARRARTEADQHFDEVLSQLRELDREHLKRAARMNALARALPPEDAELHRQSTALSEMRGRVETMKGELSGLRKDFAGFIEKQTRAIAGARSEIQQTFHVFAEGFLVEKCELKWEPHRVRVGQTGNPIAFPNFSLEMGGSDFSTPQRRHGPDQVSESQREFIDLSFRMALMKIAGEGGVGSLVIDAPESSLDAVFVKRAAKVLMRFGREGAENRLVVTSNLIEGDLIPALIAEAGIDKPSNPRVVDLLRLARPTAATKRLGTDYARVRRELFVRAKAIR